MNDKDNIIESKVEFQSSNRELNEGFNWAKNQALKYVFTGDPVGDWYEASLPGRYAFCMRDVSHQSTGAQVLGLQKLNKNMLRKFAQNISEKRDWCSYWEINKYNLPAPVDYKNDEDFWYNLPANFDILDCCYRQYLWTGDSDYIKDDVFLKFYEHTVEDYVKAWDINDDGIMEHKGLLSYRGIASYMEGYIDSIDDFVGHDMVCAQYAGYMAYANILKINKDIEKAKVYENRAENLKQLFNLKWWNEEKQSYYVFAYGNGEFGFVSQDNGSFDSALYAPLYFNIVEGEKRLNRALNSIINCKNTNVEAMSHFPEVLYKYGCDKEAFNYLMKILNPMLERREYPEVSYAAVGSIVSGMMGIKPNAQNMVVETLSRLTSEVEWAIIKNLPVFNNEITVKHRGNNETTLINTAKNPIIWRPTFKGEIDLIVINGIEVEAKQEVKEDGRIYSYADVVIDGNKESTAYAKKY